jgi:hypothetical protein
MKTESVRLWREFLTSHDLIHVYTVDPGAHAIAFELVPLMADLGRLSGWFAEGWSTARNPECRPAAELTTKLGAGSTLLLGSQTDFKCTQRVLRHAMESGATTIFVFDHWKNYAEHFGGGSLPNIIVVPDAAARDQLVAAVGERAVQRVRILPHPGIEAAAERVAAYGDTVRPNMVALLLDPTELADGLGYDWKSSLKAALDTARARPGLRLMVKPHPRQDADTVKLALATLDKANDVADLYTDETERLIAGSEQVWGMTTTALNVALATGKQIRSFQIGRNSAGARASNPHIEPFAIVR